MPGALRCQPGVVMEAYLGLFLGAFLAGAIISLLSREESSDLRLKLNALGYGFFIPIFFIMVGVNLDLYAVFESPRTLLLVPLMLVLAYVIKMVASLFFRINFTWRQTLAGGVLLSSHLSLEIAISAIALILVPQGPLSWPCEKITVVIVLASPFQCSSQAEPGFHSSSSSGGSQRYVRMSTRPATTATPVWPNTATGRPSA